MYNTILLYTIMKKDNWRWRSGNIGKIAKWTIYDKATCKVWKTSFTGSCRKVMFSVTSVRQSVILPTERWGPIWPLPMMHWTPLHRDFGGCSKYSNEIKARCFAVPLPPTSPPPPDIFKLIHHDAHTVGKLVAWILLGWFLVHFSFSWPEYQDEYRMMINILS